MGHLRQFDYPTILLIRHGSTSFNTGGKADRFKGTKFDLPLTAKGREEVEKDAKILVDYDIAEVRTSDMKRSQQTADIICKCVGCKPVAVAALDPWDIGYLSGHLRTQAQARVEFYISHPTREVPEGEGYGEWFDRFTGEIAREMAKAEHQRDRGTGRYRALMDVTHSCGLMATEAYLGGGEPEVHGMASPPPARISLIEKRGGRWRWKGKLAA